MKANPGTIDIQILKQLSSLATGFNGMVSKRVGLLLSFILLVFISGCSTLGEDSLVLTQSMEPVSDVDTQVVPAVTAATADTAILRETGTAISTLEPQDPSHTASPTSIITATPTQTEVIFPRQK